MSKVGLRIKNRRKELKISAEQLASILNVSAATIYRYEKGDIDKVPSKVLDPIAKALDTTPAWLMGWQQQDRSEEAQVNSRIQKMHENPRLGILFDKSSKMTNKDLDAVMSIVDAILRERDAD